MVEDTTVDRRGNRITEVGHAAKVNEVGGANHRLRKSGMSDATAAWLDQFNGTDGWFDMRKYLRASCEHEGMSATEASLRLATYQDEIDRQVATKTFVNWCTTGIRPSPLLACGGIEKQPILDDKIKVPEAPTITLDENLDISKTRNVVGDYKENRTANIVSDFNENKMTIDDTELHEVPATPIVKEIRHSEDVAILYGDVERCWGDLIDMGCVDPAGLQGYDIDMRSLRWGCVNVMRNIEGRIVNKRINSTYENSALDFHFFLLYFELFHNSLQVFRKDRVDRIGGGILIAISSSVPCYLIESPTPSDVDAGKKKQCYVTVNQIVAH
uniref:Uncharacterized protein n=1 Tax=Glossina brevipalpis TaxID=37001 RepID=A0A1A9W0X9_9MUSC